MEGKFELLEQKTPVYILRPTDTHSSDHAEAQVLLYAKWFQHPWLVADAEMLPLVLCICNKLEVLIHAMMLGWNIKSHFFSGETNNLQSKTMSYINTADFDCNLLSSSWNDKSFKDSFISPYLSLLSFMYSVIQKKFSKEKRCKQVWVFFSTNTICEILPGELK